MTRIADVAGNFADFDREQTIAAYAGRERGFTDTCDCEHCAAYRKVRRRELFVPSMLAACDAIGIDVTKEFEQFYTEVGDSKFVVIGTFFFAGEFDQLVSAPPLGAETDWWVFDDIYGTAADPDAAFGERPACILFTFAIRWT